MDTFDKIMENSDDMITLQTDDGETVSFYVLEETKMNGETYLLVSDSKAVSYTHLTLPTNREV